VEKGGTGWPVAMDIFFSKGGDKSFAVHFIRRRKAKKAKESYKIFTIPDLLEQPISAKYQLTSLHRGG
jgi:hypothetical protein